MLALPHMGRCMTGLFLFVLIMLLLIFANSLGTKHTYVFRCSTHWSKKQKLVTHSHMHCRWTIDTPKYLLYVWMAIHVHAPSMCMHFVRAAVHSVTVGLWGLGDCGVVGTG